MFFMFAVTLCSLMFLAVQNFNRGIYVLSIIAGLLFVVSLVLIWLAKNSLKKEMQYQSKVEMEKVG